MRAALVGSCLAVVAGAAPADAQIVEAWSRASTLDISTRPVSARLEAMGGLVAAVEEEGNRVTLSDFSDNPAAFFADRDTSVFEQYSLYERFDDNYFNRPNSDIQRKGAFRSIIRSDRHWALGLEGVYGGMNASRHDELGAPDLGRFIRDFDLPYPRSLLPVLGDRDLGATISYPRAGVSYGHQVMRALAVAGRFRYRHENESRYVADPYPLNHTSVSYEYTGAASLRHSLGGSLVGLGGFASWASEHVDGLSETRLNEDVFDWYRPRIAFGMQGLVHAGSWLRGIVDARHSSHNGEEVAIVNWAPQFFMNPLPPQNSQQNIFKRKWSAFLSGHRRNELASRWMADIPHTPAHVGVRYHYYRELEWIHPNAVILDAVRPLDLRRVGYSMAAGGSADLPDGKGLVAVEVEVAREGRADFTGQVRDISTVDMSYRFGAEYWVLRSLPLRGGVALLRRDYDRRDGEPPIKGIRLSAGTGFHVPLLTTRLDISYAHEHLHHAPTDPSREISQGDQVAFVFRRYF